MPITPYHIGPALLFGTLFSRLVNVPVLVVASVIVDIEPLVVIVAGLDMPLHGFFHSFLGGSIAALFLGVVLVRMKKSVSRITEYLNFREDVSLASVFAASFVGIYFHIFLDSFLYADIRPFYPLGVNPIYGVVSYGSIVFFCVAAFVSGALVYGYLLVKK